MTIRTFSDRAALADLTEAFRRFLGNVESEKCWADEDPVLESARKALAKAQKALAPVVHTEPNPNPCREVDLGEMYEICQLGDDAEFDRWSP